VGEQLKSLDIQNMMFLKIIGKIEVIGWNGEKRLTEEVGNKTFEIIELPEGRKPFDF
jgi:hypothetical protein